MRNLYIEDPEDTIERKIIESRDGARVRGGVHQARDPRAVPEHGLVRHQRRQDRRSASRPPRRSSSTRTSPSSTSARPRCSRACRRRRPTTTPSSTPTAPRSAAPRCSTAMVEQGYISESAYRETLRDGLGLERGYRYEPRDEQYFFDFVQQELIDEYGVETVREGGLKVYTTLDPRLQAAAAAGDRRTPGLRRRQRAGLDQDARPARSSRWPPRSPTRTASSTSPRRAGASRAPRSSRFVLTAAVDQGIDPDSTYYSAPSSITLFPYEGGEAWTVSGGGSGSMSLRAATASSVNTVYAQLVIDVGPENFTRWPRSWASPARSSRSRPMCSAAPPSAARCSRCRTPTRRSPTAVSTTTRPRSRRSSSPTARSTSPRTPRATRVVEDGVAYRSPT